MKLLLHCCCAPCSIAVVSDLRNEDINFDLFWYNPNIKPEDEYNKRLKCLVNFAEKENLKIIRANSVSFGAENSCESCYRARLEKTAEYASQNGYETFTTTLLISPYQDHELIKKIGNEVAAQYKIDFYYKDFRSLFREGQKEARARGFYMQKYCGCGRTGNREQGSGIRNHGFTFRKNITSYPGSQIPDPKKFFNRLELLTGNNNFQKLQQTRIIIFGVGGVGSWCAEALVRSGIGKIDIVDFDTVCEGNINRQLQATSKTVGMSKVEVLKNRLIEVNPECKIIAHNKLFSKETADSFNIADFDFVIDAIDMVQNKIDLIETVCNKGVKLFSSMGMALKMDPLRIKTASIWKTEVCPLARLVRQGLRKRGFTKDFTVVYSTEERILTQRTQRNAEEIKRVNGSIVTVTASAGLQLANLVILDIINSC